MKIFHLKEHFKQFKTASNYRILLTTALSFKVEVMIYCPLPDPLRSGYFLCCYMSESYAFVKIYFFVIFGEGNVKAW